MNATLTNRVRLFIHCLLHFHRAYKWTLHKPDEIGCADCDFTATN